MQDKFSHTDCTKSPARSSIPFKENTMIRYLMSSILSGVFATLLMDVGGMLVRTTGLTAGAPPKIIGKWFMYLLRGRFIHADIISSPEIPISMPLVGAIHYGI